MDTHSRLRVLIVDDEPLIRWSIGQTLVERGHHVTETGDAAGARSALRDGAAFDIVLLDYRLPDSNDLSLLASIRRSDPAPRVIMMTAFGRPDMIRDAIVLGAFCVVNKPFELHAMADLVASAAGRGETH